MAGRPGGQWDLPPGKRHEAVRPSPRLSARLRPGRIGRGRLLPLPKRELRPVRVRHLRLPVPRPQREGPDALVVRHAPRRSRAGGILPRTLPGEGRGPRLRRRLAHDPDQGPRRRRPPRGPLQLPNAVRGRGGNTRLPRRQAGPSAANTASSVSTSRITTGTAPSRSWPSPSTSPTGPAKSSCSTPMARPKASTGTRVT